MIIIFGITIFLAIIVTCMSFKGNKGTSQTPIPTTPLDKIPSTLGRPSTSEYLKKKPLFIKTWQFKEFRKKFDKIQYGNPANGLTGERFKSCRFFKEGEPVTYVGFYKVPGELSSEELKRRAKELKVGLKKSGRYLIYTGDMPYIEESDPIDLGLQNI